METVRDAFVVRNENIFQWHLFAQKFNWNRYQKCKMQKKDGLKKVNCVMIMAFYYDYGLF